MRTFAVRSFGEAPGIRDLPIPAADGALLMRVRYAGVNPIDYKLVEQLNAASHYPFVLGMDFAGVVERVPAGERDLRTGERVFGIARAHGSYAEYTAVTPGSQIEPIARIPEGVTDEQAAALPIPATTALGSIELMGVTAGQRVAVMGATGGVGGYAVQMARARGAHVIATVRGDADEARRLGADEVYDSNTVDVIDALRGAHPDGVDAVLDLVNGKDAIRRDADIVKSGGALISTLYAVDVQWFAERHITASNISSSATSDSAAAHTNPAISSRGLSEIARMLADGTITARICSRVELDGAGELLDRLRKGLVRGKAVLRL
ncbi:MAG TPA: NADP-dependent oxidoreductase [Gemmatimonadaceae bacterium]|nr:NADP-dependent oxidoreductase [Gemmatimonadaceae bacterium]